MSVAREVRVERDEARGTRDENAIGIHTPTRSHQGATLRPRLPGRTEARPYDRSVLRNVGCLFLAHK